MALKRSLAYLRREGEGEMNAISHSDSVDFDVARAKLMHDSSLHWFHWLAIALSLTITFGAWHVSKQYAEEKLTSQFDHEARQVVALVSDRMLKYEDALWGGVGAIAAANATNSQFNEHNWRAFSNTLKIDKKYPGISGIGVIHRVESYELETYLAQLTSHSSAVSHAPRTSRERIFTNYLHRTGGTEP